MSKYANLITATDEKSIKTRIELKKPSNQTKKFRRYCSYVTGPIPMAWVSEACQLGGKEAKLAWVCWFLYGVNNRLSFSLSNVCAEKLGLTREAKRLAIKSLEDAGMIFVERPPSKSPVITIIIRNADFSATFKDI